MHFDEPQSQYDQIPPGGETPRRGWFARNWFWFVPLVVVLPILLCLGCCTGVLTVGVSMLKTSEPYTEALAAVQAEPRVQAAIGTPIEDDTWFPVGEMNVSGDRGEARFDFRVKGPEGRAHVRTESRRIGGTWHIVELIVTIEETGERIVVDQPDDDDADDAPLWDAEAGAPGRAAVHRRLATVNGYRLRMPQDPAG